MANETQTQTQNQTNSKTYRIRESLRKRGVILSDHEVNLAILYSSCDTAYHKKDNGSYDFAQTVEAIDKAYANYLKYEEQRNGSNIEIC